jgi:hypothetical protein
MLIHAIMKDCLFKQDEIVDGKPPADAVIIEGVVCKFGLHPARLASHAEDIDAVLAGLPNEFYRDGGGWQAVHTDHYAILGSCEFHDSSLGL